MMQLPDIFLHGVPRNGPIRTEEIVHAFEGAHLGARIWLAWHRAEPGRFIVVSGFSESRKARRLRAVRTRFDSHGFYR
jgi:hypothetical protein